MEWLQRSIFGGRSGGGNEEFGSGSSINVDGEESTLSPSTPIRRPRKRNRRDGDSDNDGILIVEEDNVDIDMDYDNNDGDDDNDMSPLINRELRYKSINSLRHGDESEGEDDDGSEEGILNTTVDTVENPVDDDESSRDGDNFNLLSGADGYDTVYVGDDSVRHHVEVDNKHWRDMLWDPIANKFYYTQTDDMNNDIPDADQYKIIISEAVAS